MSKSNNLEENENFLSTVVRPKFEALLDTGEDADIEKFLGWLEHEEGYIVESQVLRKRWEDHHWANQ